MKKKSSMENVNDVLKEIETLEKKIFGKVSMLEFVAPEVVAQIEAEEVSNEN